MKNNLWLTCVLISLLSAVTVWAQNNTAGIKALADNGRSFDARKAEITKRWGELRPSFAGDSLYDFVPSSKAPYAAGKVKDAVLRDGINMLNFIRFLAGLPDDVELRADYVELAQHGSVLNAASGRIAHQQDRPGDMPDDFYQKASRGIGSSNLHQGQRSLSDAVLGWTSDSDGGNRSRLGHRRWVLNPAMKYAGFGLVSGFSSLYSFDASRPNQVDYQALCFPGGAAFPVDFFKGNWAWSVSLNPELYQTPDRNEVTVTLTEQSSGKRWSFPDANDSSNFFNIDTARFGIPNCIIFLPSGITAYSGTYRVEITGLKEKSGRAAALSYATTFYPMESQASSADFQTSINNTGLTITKYTGSMKTVTIPDTLNGLPVTRIGKDAFTYADISQITLPAALTVIEDQSFWYSGITSIVIPAGVKSIGNQAFSYCSKLTRVTLPGGIANIGDFAFMECKGLRTIVLPPAMRTIGFAAFRGCDNLDPAIRSDLMKRFGSRAFRQ